MRRRYLFQWLKAQPGCSVQVANGLVRIEKGNHLTYLRNQWYYPKWYLRIIFFVYRDMWGDIHWKEAYNNCINNRKIKIK